MKRILRTIGCAAAALFVSLSAGAYAYWVFGTDNSSSTDIGAASAIDDIKENYVFGKSTEEVTYYTMYVFPSTVYYDLYYSSGSTGVLPEDRFGYIEPTIDDDGDAVLNDDGEPTYTVHYAAATDGSDNSSNKDSYLNYVAAAPYTGSTEYYRAGNGYGVDLDTLSVGYSTSSVAPVDYYSSDDDDQFSANGDWTWKVGDPDADKTVLDCFDEETIDVEYKSGWTLKGKYSLRNQHALDRFGYWNYLNYAEGRHLPIKLTFTNSLNLELYGDVVRNPWCDASDPNNWFNYSFGGWYAPSSPNDKDNFKPIATYSSGSWSLYGKDASEATQDDYDNVNVRFQDDLFSNSDGHDLFDVMQRISEYADSNGVIRLFPSFSNGKNGSFSWSPYEKTVTGSDGTTVTTKGIDASKLDEFGTSDAIKMNFQYKGGDNDVQGTNDGYPATEYVPERYFRWHSGRYTMESSTLDTPNETFNGTDRDVKMASVDGFELNDIYDSISFDIDYQAVPNEHSGTWDPVFTLTSDFIEEMIGDYGTGLYNFFIFECPDGEAKEYTWTDNNTPSAGYKTVTTYKEFVTDFSYTRGTKQNGSAGDGRDGTVEPTGALTGKGDAFCESTAFSEMNGKKLRYFHSPNNVTEYCEETETWATSSKCPSNRSNVPGDRYAYHVSRCFLFAFEKASDARLIKDFSTDGTKAAMDETISSRYHQGNQFFKIDDIAYEDEDGDGNATYAHVTDNQYIYRAESVDFTEDEEVNFQIRWHENYYAQSLFDLDGAPKSSSSTETYGSLVINYDSTRTSSSYLQTEKYVKGSEYFETSTANDEQILSIKPKTAGGDPKAQAGIYDIIIIRDNNVDVGETVNYYLYAYRHTNIFVKIMLNDVEQGSDGFAIHTGDTFGTLTDSVTDLSAYPNWILYQHTYFLGQRMGDDDYQVLGDDGYAETKSDKTEIDAAISQIASLQEKTKEKYFIKDHVTGLLVGWYDSSGGLQLDLTIKKNYVLFLGYNGSST